MTMPAAAPLGNPDTQTQNAAPKSFREATIERTDILVGESFNISAAIQRFERPIDGSGYLYGLWLLFAAASTGNGATVANSEDIPFDAFDTVILRDVNGELINLPGYSLYLANLICKQYASRFTDQSASTYLFSQSTTGAGATAGSFTFALRVPVGLNRRDLTGILGNQDRAQKYFIRLDVAANSVIWSTPPSGGSVACSIQKIYENYAVPMPVTPQGQAQQVYPDSFGTMHFITSTLTDAPPQGGSTVSHFLRRLGNTVRWIALEFRINAVRSTVETNRPTSLRLKIGEDTLFNESYEYRRAIMYERYGFDFPNGIIVYDAMHDFETSAGNEIGDDYYHTQAIVNAQFQISYPAGFGSTNNSLRITTDDLQRVGAPIR